MSGRIDQIREATAKARKLLRDRAAGGDLHAFAHYVNNQYLANWHHTEIIREIQEFLTTDKHDRLMLFMPPQHGKSEIASRMAPAFALGMNPNLSIAACSYGADLARKFNREVQRIIEGKAYREVFPKTRLNGRRVADDSKGDALRNTHEFEIVGYRGSYKAVGIGGGLSGRRVDLAVIDDPVKDAAQAYSEKIRESVWDWYLSVLETRLHNNSKVLLIMTRWHEDDLAGRLLATQGERWKVISIPAIMEGPTMEWDHRKMGEPLWPERHSLERLLQQKDGSPTWFASLFQQQPSPAEGGLIKRAWFPRYSRVPAGPRTPTHFYLDGAYTEKEQNDPSGILGGLVTDQKMFLTSWATVRMEFPELVRFIPDHMKRNGGTAQSALVIEGKANGLSVAQELRRYTDLNVIIDKLPPGDKVGRTAAQTATYESGKVWLPDGEIWAEQFIEELAMFPNGAHDEAVDCLNGLTRKLLLSSSGRKTYRSAR